MNFLPDKYFRFNPVLDEKFDIDVKDEGARFAEGGGKGRY